MSLWLITLAIWLKGGASRVARHYSCSALKPIQATLITEGVADSESLTAQQLAVACSSHNGEAGHVEVVDRWLNLLGSLTMCLSVALTFPLTLKLPET